MNLLSELRRRNVLRVGAAYVVTAWLIVQVAETLFPVYGLSDAAVRWVVNALAVGLVPVLVLAWVFEWTPEGLKRDAEVAADAPSSREAARRLDRVILVVLALALGYFAFDKFVLDPARDTALAESARQEGRSEAITQSYGDQSIAVLAFQDMSPDRDQEYLSDGIAEEVLNLLAQVPELRVISRQSAFSFKGKDVPIPEIARILNVAHILEGSVRKAGDRIRVTAQLIEARSDTHLWSQTWDRTLDDVFAIQDELAADMVDQLQVRLLGEPLHARRVDPEAYLLYLEAHHLLSLYDYEPSVPLLERAVGIDPDFADAWADLTMAYTYMSPTYGQSDHTGDEYYFKQRAAFERMVAIAPDHPRTMAWLAFDRMEQHGEYAAAARGIERALALHPRDGSVIEAATWLARVIGRSDLALPLARANIDRDPLCNRCSYNLSRNLMRAGRYAEAEREILRFRSLTGVDIGRITLGLARFMQGDFDRVPDALTWDGEITPEASDYEAMMRAYLELLVSIPTGQAADAGAAIATFRANYPEYDRLGPGILAQLYATAGDADRGFEALERYRESREKWSFADLLGDPLLAPLHDDPRWMEMKEAAGTAPWQVAEINYRPQIPPGFETGPD